MCIFHKRLMFGRTCSDDVLVCNRLLDNLRENFVNALEIVSQSSIGILILEK